MQVEGVKAMELFGREFSLEQAIWLVEVYATPDEDLVHRAALEIIAALRETQRREQAAVADIEKMMRICEKGSCHFCADGDCTESPYCSPKWRGPQDAEKGENNA